MERINGNAHCIPEKINMAIVTSPNANSITSYPDLYNILRLPVGRGGRYGPGGNGHLILPLWNTFIDGEEEPTEQWMVNTNTSLTTMDRELLRREHGGIAYYRCPKCGDDAPEGWM
jgi:hypothetical protein